MIKDRYGNVFFSENSIVIFDTALDYDSGLCEDSLGLKLNSFDKSKFLEAYEIDVGGGADWPAVVYELSQSLIPFSAIAAAFFYGDRIEKSTLAWKRMAQKLLSLIPKHSFTDANGAALIALNEIFETTGASDVKLLAYTWIDEEIEFFDAEYKTAAAFNLISKMDEIQAREKQFGMGLHSTPVYLFKFAVAGEVIFARVQGSSVEISK
jgi:hypothetical protein